MIKSKLYISGKLRLAIACFTMYMVGSNLFIISPLLPYIASDLKIDIEKAGWLFGSFSIAYAFSAPIFGMVSDKYSQKHGRQHMITIGLVIFTGANFLAFFAKSFDLMILGRLLSGIGSGIVSPAIYAAIGDNASPANRGRSISVIAFGFLASLLTSAVVGIYLKNIFGSDKVFLILGLISAILILPNLIMWSKDHVKTHDHVNEIRNIGKVAMMLCPVILWAMSLYGLYGYLGFGLVIDLKLPGQIASMVFFVWGVGALVGNYLGGYGADRFGAKKTIKISLFLTAIVMLILFLLLKSSVMASSAVGVVFGLLALMAYPFFPAQQARIVEESKKYLGTLLALNSSAIYVGIALGSMICGSIIKSFGFAFIPLFSFVAALLGALIIKVSA